MFPDGRETIPSNAWHDSVHMSSEEAVANADTVVESSRPNFYGQHACDLRGCRTRRDNLCVLDVVGRAAALKQSETGAHLATSIAVCVLYAVRLCVCFPPRGLRLHAARFRLGARALCARAPCPDARPLGVHHEGCRRGANRFEEGRGAVLRPAHTPVGEAQGCGAAACGEDPVRPVACGIYPASCGCVRLPELRRP